MRSMCTFDECEKRQVAKSLCDGHYRQLKSGKPLAPLRGGKPKPCKFETCKRIARSRGWCNSHYSQWLNGVELRELRFFGPADERFWRMVDKRGKDECWQWLGSCNKQGYGQFDAGRGGGGAHKFSWKLNYGEIPPGHVIDHRCWNEGCVNPEHLRCVTQEWNAQNRRGARKDSATGVRGVKKCGKGYVGIGDTKGVRTTLGPFSTIEEADTAISAWRRENMPGSTSDQ